MSDQEFYDACYDAWMAGYNPDALDWDRYDTDVAHGYTREEAASREFQRVIPVIDDAD